MKTAAAAVALLALLSLYIKASRADGLLGLILHLLGIHGVWVGIDADVWLHVHAHVAVFVTIGMRGGLLGGILFPLYGRFAPFNQVEPFIPGNVAVLSVLADLDVELRVRAIVDVGIAEPFLDYDYLLLLPLLGVDAAVGLEIDHVSIVIDTLRIRLLSPELPAPPPGRKPGVVHVPPFGPPALLPSEYDFERRRLASVLPRIPIGIFAFVHVEI
ncbi:hypothetical protein PROFUN_02202 [Planoprotostelium fungivorum]|uniref:Uncharacterized protein n=1 Tax=Planoprotostelium fungivorum TaxID=1890364 RepID=A0A2P6NZI2_9EUKA|nr:hypothetical protein PROFUN_02202 [Planoprotostelium fungivorum]